MQPFPWPSTPPARWSRLAPAMALPMSGPCPAARELLRIFHGAPVSQIAFHPKANQLATASDDGHVRIFDVARAAIVADFKCPDKIVSTSFSPGGDLLAALSSEGVVSLFDPVHRKLLRTLVGGEAGFNLAFSSNGKRVATASGDFAFVWDVTTGRQLLKATHAASSETLTPQQWICNAAITSDGKLLAYAARGDSSAHVWNVETGRQILELKHDSAVAAVSFNADGTKLGTGSYDGTARVWELPSGSELERARSCRRRRSCNFQPGWRPLRRWWSGRLGFRLRDPPRRPPRLLRFARRRTQRCLQPGWPALRHRHDLGALHPW